MTNGAPPAEEVTPLILMVDDEPDLEALIVQKFRGRIRDGWSSRSRSNGSSGHRIC